MVVLISMLTFVNFAKSQGGLAIAVPGDIKGYYEAHRRHGSREVSWRDLVEPSIRLARNGYRVTDDLGTAIIATEEVIREEPSMR